MDLSISRLIEDSALIGTKCSIKGWVKQIRLAKGGKLLFLHIGDGTTLKMLQIVYDLPPEFDQEITFESSVEVIGTLIASPAKGQKVEITASSVKLIGGCPVDYPFQKSRQGYTLDYLRQYPHLRPKTKIFSSIMRVRHQLAMATQKFYHDEGFYWIHTPLLTTSDCEGAGAAFKVHAEKTPEFFKDKQAYLTVSGQLHVEPYACSMRRVYTFGPSFRAESSSTSRHLAEFWMLEPEMAFSTLDDVINLSQKYIKSVIGTCLRECRDELNLLETECGETLINKLERTISEDFAIIDYTQAIKLLIESGKKFDKPCEWGTDLGSDQERYICEEIFKKPTYITHYPAKIKAFYMYTDDLENKDMEKQTVASTDLLFPGIGEVLGGSQREHRYDILKAKMDSSQLDYNWYLETRKYGGVPHAGFGLGFDRLLRYITGINHICDVVPYPIRYEHLTS